MSEAGHDTHHGNYVKIWAILVVLLAVSVAGPMLEIRFVTLLTAFGIALVKAYLVGKHFMHINHTPKFVPYLVATCLVFMLLLFAGTAPDIMNDTGSNWEKPAWVAEEEAWAAGAGSAGAQHHQP
jgi:caa(3)-type oxidase subunit IV